MPHELIGSCGSATSGDRDRISFELSLGITLLRAICGREPAGTSLEVVWQDHELGQYAEICLVWEQGALFEEETEYLNRCEVVLNQLDECIDWSTLDEIRSAEQQRSGRRRHTALPDPFGEPHTEKDYVKPHPALLLLANADGTLQEEFADYQDLLQLEPPDLTPVWGPQEVEGHSLTPDERALNFQATLEAVLAVKPRGATATPTSASLTPQRVLKSLLFLREALHEGPTPAPD